MLNSPRWLLTLISISFGLYHALLGALSWRSYDDKWLLVVSIAVYIGAFSIAVGASRGLAIARFFGALVGASAVLSLVIAQFGIHPGHRDPYSTWYIGGMAALLAVLAARGQSAIAWLAAGLVVWLSVLEVGFPGATEIGLEGIPILIGAASATAAALARADEEINELRTAEIAAEAGIVAASAASEQRRDRLNQVLERALPALSLIAATKGQLSAEQQNELLQLEASLRDEIRGKSLVNDAVRKAANDARARGVDVVVMDEGGLSEVSDTQREHILSRVASAIDSVKAGKIVIRSPRGEKWLVTVMATRPGTSAPDLWLKF
ncbi:MAG: hypothetical protein RLZZ06_954 [Actinomycetota bacterium]